MKISCQSCGAKYTIADEKVLGKIVKIRCKKCGATIVINGNEVAAAHGGGGDEWTVNVADGDQRTMTPQDIADAYAQGVVDDETYLWKDGMADWLPLREVPEVHSFCGSRASGAPQMSSFPPPAAAGAGFAASEAATSPQGDSGGALFGDSAGNGGGMFGSGGSDRPQAAVRSGGGADLFGGAAQAGGEEDVMTSAPSGGGGLAAGGASEPAALTGQRNENSVLFSLAALTENKPGSASQPPATPEGDASGLIDIKALAATMDSGGPKNGENKVDDIMNLGGGGAFGAALAAPVLAPPTGGGLASIAPGEGKNKTMLFAVIGGAALIAVAIIVVGVIALSGDSKDDNQLASNDTTAASGAVANPGVDNTAAGMGTNAAGPVTTGETAGGDSLPAAPGTGEAKATAKAHGGSPAPRHASKPSTKPAAVETPPPVKTTSSKPKSLAAAMAEAAGTSGGGSSKSSGGGGTQKFDRGAAAAALSRVNVNGCKKAGGPTGSGHVRVTFAPSGNVTKVDVDTAPYSGTSVGGCVASKFKGASIPAFSGGPVTVGKSFSIR